MTQPSFLEDSYKTARTTHRVVMVLCLGLLATCGANESTYASAQKQLGLLDDVPWGEYERTQAWPEMERRLEKGTLSQELGRIATAIRSAAEASGVTIDEESLAPSNLVLLSSLTPRDAETVSDYQYYLQWPEAWLTYPDPAEIEEAVKDVLPALSQPFSAPPQGPGRRTIPYGPFPDWEMSEPYPGEEPVGPMGPLPDRVPGRAPGYAEQLPARPAPDDIVASVDFDYLSYAQFVDFITRVAPGFPPEDYPSQGLIKVVFTSSSPSNPDLPLPELSFFVSFLETEHFPLGPVEQWLDPESKRVLWDPELGWLHALEGYALDISDLAPIKARRELRSRYEATQGKVSYFGTELRGSTATLIGTVLLLGALFLLLSDVRHVLGCCRAEGVRPGVLPFSLMAPRLGRAVFLLTIVLLPCATLGVLAWRAPGVVRVVTSAGILLAMLIAASLHRILGDAWGGSPEPIPEAAPPPGAAAPEFLD